MAKAPKRDAAWALERLRATLEEAGQTLASAEVIYKKVVPWGSATARLFLVRYVRGDDYASVGCVGPFVRLCDDLPMTDIESLHRKTVNRRLVELFVGQFFIDRAARAGTHPCTTTAAQVEAAFKARTDRLSVNRVLATAGAENMGSTWVMGLPARFCALRCHADPIGVWLENMFHMIAPVTITFDLSEGGTSTRYTGQVEINQPQYIRSHDGRAIDSMRPVADLQVSFPRHRLANVIGSIYGPGEILDRWAGANFVDR